jgi:hypothetical protein
VGRGEVDGVEWPAMSGFFKSSVRRLQRGNEGGEATGRFNSEEEGEGLGGACPSA